MNNTTFTNLNFTVPEYSFDKEPYDRLYYSYYAVTSFYILAGTPLCVWFMAAILTSADMRRRLRNQLVCAICLSYMLKSTISGMVEMFVMIALREWEKPFNCYLYSFFLTLRIVLEFAGSWQVVILLLVYLAQIFDYDPSSTLTPMTVTVGKVALLVLPFALAIILVPSIGWIYTRGLGSIDSTTPGCIIADVEGYLVLRTVDYMVPLIISVLLLILAAVLSYRRLHRGCLTFRAVRTGLTNQGRQVDNITAYLVVIVVDIICRLPATFVFVEMTMTFYQRLAFNFISWMIIDVRSIILPWGWLLLEDIRERIKIWRPWYRPGPGIDLTVTYSREENSMK